MNCRTLQTLRAVKMRHEARLRSVLRSAKINKSGIGDDPRVHRGDPIDIVRRDQSSVLDAKVWNLILAGVVRLRGLDRGERFVQFLDLGCMKRGVESAPNCEADRTGKSRPLVLIPRHELDAREPDVHRTRHLIASLCVLDLLPA